MTDDTKDHFQAIAPAHAKNEEVLAIWRIGLVAYRDALRQELHVSKCYQAAADAIREKHPDLTEREAKRHAITAVAWASRHHNEWLNKGVPKRKWIWPPTAEGVGDYRTKSKAPKS